MELLRNLTRRGALASKVAFLGFAALPKTAMAHGGAPTVETSAVLPARWTTATADELAAFVGDRFRVRTKDHGMIVLKLVALETLDSGPARPAGLPRREGVTALFESPDMGPLIADTSGVYRVSHSRIGSADLFLSAIPRRDGGTYIELVLN